MSGSVRVKKDGLWVQVYPDVVKPFVGNVATGGTVVDVPDWNGTGHTYRVHTFASDGTFTVSAAPEQFKVLAVGGGGNGAGQSGGQAGGGGGAGGVFEGDFTIPVGAHSVVAGAAGAASGIANIRSVSGGVNGGSAGGASGEPTTHTGGQPGQDPGGNRGGGGGAGAGGNGGDANYWGGAPGVAVTSTITGAVTSYAEGGGGGHTDAQGQSGAGGARGRYPGSGGGGGGTTQGGATGGQTGVVIIAYRLSEAPAGPTLTGTGNDGMAILSWTEITDAEAYQVDQAGTVVKTVTGLTTTISGLTNGTPYSFRVRALYAWGAGSWSAEAHVTPAAYNDATGGTVTEYLTPEGKKMRVHTFPAGAGTFEVTAGSRPFRVLLVAGGGNGGNHCGADGSSGGSGGGGGVYHATDVTIAPGSHALTVGAARENTTAFGLTVGYGGNGAVSSCNHTYQNPGEAGGVAANGNGGIGGGGSKDNNWNDPANGANAGEYDITGTAQWYGRNGRSFSDWQRPGSGGGGMNGAISYNNPNGGPTAGATGTVIVSYETAPPPPPPPLNEATGGTVTDVPGWNGTGQTWRIHTFTASDTFTITKNPEPFRVLAVGGGGPGATTGGGGGGRAIEEPALSLPLGAHPVTVGGPGQATSLSGWLVSQPGDGGSPWDGGNQQGGASNFPGGSGQFGGYNEIGGGGGGAGGPGSSPGNGGAGLATTIRGTAEHFAGGGGGGAALNSSPGSGQHGGGSGGKSAGTGGAANTGGGGGGGGLSPSGPGASGGSGILIVAYRIA